MYKRMGETKMTRLLSGAAGRPVSPGWTGCGRTTNPPPSEAGRLRPPQQRSRVFWNTEPLLRNGERKVSDEFSLRPTRDPSARRRKLTPDAKHPSGHPRLRRPKGALCSPIVRHGFANQHEAQTGTVPVHFKIYCGNQVADPPPHDPQEAMSLWPLCQSCLFPSGQNLPCSSLD